MNKIKLYRTLQVITFFIAWALLSFIFIKYGELNNIETVLIAAVGAAAVGAAAVGAAVVGAGIGAVIIYVIEIIIIWLLEYKIEKEEKKQ